MTQAKLVDDHLKAFAARAKRSGRAGLRAGLRAGAGALPVLRLEATRIRSASWRAAPK